MEAKQLEAVVANAMNEFAKNPFWMEKIVNAPYGALCRMSLNFWFSENRDKPEFDVNDYREVREYVEDHLTREDLDYLIKQEDSEEARAHFQELLDKLGTEQRQEMTPPEGGGGATGAKSSESENS